MAVHFLFLKLVPAVVALAVAANLARPHVAVVGMRFFRDVGRMMSRRRRLRAGAHNSLTVLLGREAPLPQETLSENGVVVDVEELRWADGSPYDDEEEKDEKDRGGEEIAAATEARTRRSSKSRKPLWLSLRGRVYDVSAGARHYGSGRPYHAFVGKDATRAFCTGCLEDDCLIASLEGLTEAQVREADRWVEYYEFHDRYSFVGRLQDTTGNIEALVEMALEAEAVGDYRPPKVPTDSSGELVEATAAAGGGAESAERGEHAGSAAGIRGRDDDEEGSGSAGIKSEIGEVLHEAEGAAADVQ